MRILFWVIVIGCLYYFFHNSQDPATNPSLVLSDSAAEAQRQEVIRQAKEHKMEGYPEYTDAERHIVYAKSYERANDTPDFIIIVFLILLGFSWWAIFGPNPFNLLVSIICCLVLLLSNYYQWIVLAFIINALVIPTLACMGIKGLFSKQS